jgi:hypothetical protein
MSKKADQIREEQYEAYVIEEDSHFVHMVDHCDEGMIDLSSEKLKLWEVLCLIDKENLELEDFEQYAKVSWITLGERMVAAYKGLFRFRWEIKEN